MALGSSPVAVTQSSKIGNLIFSNELRAEKRELTNFASFPFVPVRNILMLARFSYLCPTFKPSRNQETKPSQENIKIQKPKKGLRN